MTFRAFLKEPCPLEAKLAVVQNDAQLFFFGANLQLLLQLHLPRMEFERVSFELGRQASFAYV